MAGRQKVMVKEKWDLPDEVIDALNPAALKKLASKASKEDAQGTKNQSDHRIGAKLPSSLPAPKFPKEVSLDSLFKWLQDYREHVKKAPLLGYPRPRNAAASLSRRELEIVVGELSSVADTYNMSDEWTINMKLAVENIAGRGEETRLRELMHKGIFDEFMKRKEEKDLMTLKKKPSRELLLAEIISRRLSSSAPAGERIANLYTHTMIAFNQRSTITFSDYMESIKGPTISTVFRAVKTQLDRNISQGQFLSLVTSQMNHLQDPNLTKYGEHYHILSILTHINDRKYRWGYGVGLAVAESMAKYIPKTRNINAPASNLKAGTRKDEKKVRDRPGMTRGVRKTQPNARCTVCSAQGHYACIVDETGEILENCPQANVFPEAMRSAIGRSKPYASRKSKGAERKGDSSTLTRANHPAQELPSSSKVSNRSECREPWPSTWNHQNKDPDSADIETLNDPYTDFSVLGWNTKDLQQTLPGVILEELDIGSSLIA